VSFGFFHPDGTVLGREKGHELTSSQCFKLLHNRPTRRPYRSRFPDRKHLLPISLHAVLSEHLRLSPQPRLRRSSQAQRTWCLRKHTLPLTPSDFPLADKSQDFGFIDPSQYTGALTYANVNDDLGAGYWEFNSGGYAIGNGTKKARSMIAIADTGTSLALVDDVVVTAFYAASPTAYYNSTYGAMVFPCADTANLADLSFYMGGAKHTMPGAYGVYAELGDGTCYGGIQSNSGIGFVSLLTPWTMTFC